MSLCSKKQIGQKNMNMIFQYRHLINKAVDCSHTSFTASSETNVLLLGISFSVIDKLQIYP